MHLTVVILTLDEEQHIKRAISSVTRIAHRIVVVDSGSTDGTVERAREAGALVLFNPFITQAKQFNWALQQLPDGTEWVLRLDADEIVSDALAEEIATRLPGLPDHIAGVTVARRISFLGRPVRHGGMFPVQVVRLLRHGRGGSEDRWMDEHIVVDGKVTSFKGELLDDNLKTLSWWINKHNSYASREVIEVLNAEFGFIVREGNANLGRSQTGAKRWIKENIYLRLPGGLRALAYFFYRYILRLGFLDGIEGTAFHLLQGFWYRYLVDLKRREVIIYLRKNDVDIYNAIESVLGIKLERPRTQPTAS
jgi:glycosyltransferase involved in cell wall biosynthesis